MSSLPGNRSAPAGETSAYTSGCAWRSPRKSRTSTADLLSALIYHSASHPYARWRSVTQLTHELSRGVKTRNAITPCPDRCFLTESATAAPGASGRDRTECRWATPYRKWVAEYPPCNGNAGRRGRLPRQQCRGAISQSAL